MCNFHFKQKMKTYFRCMGNGDAVYKNKKGKGKIIGNENYQDNLIIKFEVLNNL